MRRVALGVVVVVAACGGVDTSEYAAETPTPSPSATSSPTASPTGTPSSSYSFTVTLADVYVFDDSEPAITEPGECVFAMQAGLEYVETAFDCSDQSAYGLALAPLQVEVTAGSLLLIDVAGFEDDPTDDDAMGAFHLELAPLQAAGQHIGLAEFSPGAVGNFEATIIVAE